MSDPLQMGIAEEPSSKAKAAKRSKPVTSSDIIAALIKRFASPAWAFVEQAALGTGWSAKQGWADAMALSLWPSRGLELYGFEVKVSRADWIRELRNPQKSEQLAMRCHRWWIVAAPEVVAVSELPPSWGLIELRSGKLHDVRQAERKQAPEPDWAFVAAIFRRVADANVPKSALSEKVDELVAQLRANDTRSLEQERRSMQELRDAVDKFEAASGVRIDRWDGGRVGEAIRLLRSPNARKRLEEQQRIVGRLLLQLNETVAAMPEDPTSPSEEEDEC